MELSYKEKSAWISFVSTLFIFGYYFYQVAGLSALPIEQAQQAANGLLLRAIIMSVAVEVFFHAMLAATNRREAEMDGDERDRLFELKANNLGYWILGVGVVFCIGRLQIEANFPQFADANSSLAIPYLTAHILMFSFILSEIVRFGARIVFYRRGY